MWIPPVDSHPTPLSNFLRNSHPACVTSGSYSVENCKLSANDSTRKSCHQGPFVENAPTILTRMIQKPVEFAQKLSCPYQAIPCPNEDLYLYEFRLPIPKMMAHLANIEPKCFGCPRRTIGLLFSKKLSDNSNVCRIPLYLTKGMARAHVQLVNQFKLSANDLSLVLSTHRILCDLVCEVITRNLHSVQDTKSSSSSRLIDQFMFNPNRALVCALLCIVQWPSSTVDFEACRHLLSFAPDNEIPIFSKSFSNELPIITPQCDIIPFRRTPLDRIKPSCWRGLLLHSSSMSAADLGLVACAGPASVSLGEVECFRLSRHLQAARAHNSRTSTRPSPVTYKASTCHVHPLSAWLWFNLTLIPVVLYQLNRALCIIELGQSLLKLAPYTISGFFPVRIPDRLDAPKCMASALRVPSELDREAATSILWPTGVQPKLDPTFRDQQIEAGSLLAATTTLGADDVVNLERLEFLGDSFIKLIGTLFVYTQLPSTASEHELTNSRLHYLTNVKFAKIIETLNWSKYCTSRSYLASTQFLPPGYVLSKQAAESEEHVSRQFVTLNRKSLSDMLEALVGLLLIASGPECAFIFYSRAYSLVGDSPVQTIRENWPELFNSNPTRPTILNSQLPVEEILGYQFSQRDYLWKAFRCNSDCPGDLRDHERLEFLGDAVLDYVISFRIYNANTDFDPGVLTSCRSLITNNNVLSYMLVKLKLHEFVTHNNPHLALVIEEILAKHQKEDQSLTALDVYWFGLSNKNSPKILADAFEALIGAVFVDSCGNLVVTTDVILRCLGDRIDFVIRNAAQNTS